MNGCVRFQVAVQSSSAADCTHAATTPQGVLRPTTVVVVEGASVVVVVVTVVVVPTDVDVVSAMVVKLGAGSVVEDVAAATVVDVDAPSVVAG